MSDRDLIFADEYMIDYNAKHAAIRAGYSEKTARNAAAWINPQHPAKPKLRALIDKKIAMLSRRTGITAERVINELASIAFANIGDIVDPATGKLLPDAARIDIAAVAAIRVKDGEDFTEHETKMLDKLKALELLGKHLGMFTESLQLADATPVIVDDIGEESLPEDKKIGFNAGVG